MYNQYKRVYIDSEISEQYYIMLLPYQFKNKNKSLKYNFEFPNALIYVRWSPYTVAYIYHYEHDLVPRYTRYVYYVYFKAYREYRCYTFWNLDLI